MHQSGRSLRVRDEPCYHRVSLSSSRTGVRANSGVADMGSFVINLKEEHNQSRQRLKEAEERISQLEAALGAAGRACPPRDAPHSEVDPDMAGLAHVKANSAGNVQGRTLSPAGGDDPDRGPDPSSLLSQVQ